MAFTPEELERRRQRIYEVKPWERSTGARTERGKAIVSQNALKHGLYSSFEPIRLLARWEQEQKNMEQIRATIDKMQAAYGSTSCDSKPHPLWEQVFETMSDLDFLEKLRNCKP